ncbi:Octopine transport system permease protein OccM [Paraburkholderia caffeinitolerans]|uniref:Octopine transport system permease protein OccM n=1 Tax=Paraburkholderia caffeinitolerans TaxID=1723730 RepID=A0A6J5GQQ0_9BURK|nr:ABC transporter permease [Paraburkholderia caffeinitolerans]CAB3803622.1 Octopine transport system permease protein OccM [Paraburkholderia caffeinitolerans]
MDFELIRESLPLLWEGTLLTLAFFAITLVLSTMLAVPLAIVRVQKAWWLRWPVEVFSQVFRGTPLLVQIFIVYYGIAQIDAVRESWAWPYLRQPYWCAVISFVLNATAYTVHIFRGAIQAVPRGEIEAGHAFGLSFGALYRHIICPQALRLALPAYGNETIRTIKRTSLASAITISDLTGVANTLVARTFAPYEIFIAAGLIYLALAFAVNHLVRWLEHRFDVEVGSLV